VTWPRRPETFDSTTDPNLMPLFAALFMCCMMRPEAYTVNTRIATRLGIVSGNLEPLDTAGWRT
jgi:hypothetical protein